MYDKIVKGLLIATAAVVMGGCAAPSAYSKLSDAIRRSELKRADDLLSKNADVNRCTALMIATERQNVDAMKHYLQSTSANCARAGSGVTVLMTSASNGFVEGANLLLDSGASVNRKSDKGWTALDYAAYQQHYLVWDLIRQHGGVATMNGQQLAQAKTRELREAQQEEAEEAQRKQRSCESAKAQSQQMCYPGNELACAAAKAMTISNCD